MLANFLESLQIMWKGMVGIFAIILVIMIAVIIMNAVTKKRKEKDKTE